MKMKTTGSWNAMITGYLNMGKPLEALEHFCKMFSQIRVEYDAHNVSPEVHANSTMHRTPMHGIPTAASGIKSASLNDAISDVVDTLEEAPEVVFPMAN
ncbi:hypothetical protein V6N11_009190 [Hibiscus sabdariffa]|uniref:Pentatricopeptide repeat-containing protein n=1 Tax=Hibiscus sabdariffa TaxID=183260 RepID=A0ABR2PPW2_9ROSI